MGAGQRDGPDDDTRHRSSGTASGSQAGGQAGAQERHEPQLRHEHADDVQCIRHRGVVERGLMHTA